MSGLNRVLKALQGRFTNKTAGCSSINTEFNVFPIWLRAHTNTLISKCARGVIFGEHLDRGLGMDRRLGSLQGWLASAILEGAGSINADYFIIGTLLGSSAIVSA